MDWVRFLSYFVWITNNFHRDHVTKIQTRDPGYTGLVHNVHEEEELKKQSSSPREAPWGNEALWVGG